MVNFAVLIVAVFIVGYIFIAMESITKINKAAIAILMCVFCWSMYSIGSMCGLIPTGTQFGQGGFQDVSELGKIIEESLGEASTTLFFLMGAMTIVEIVDHHGGLNFVSDLIMSRHKRKLLWRMVFMTALLSAVLDNLTTSIVMVMILRKLVPEAKERLYFDVAIIIAANSGGAFSPIGDVTTIMLWNGKQITAGGVISHIILPSLVSFIVPTLLFQRHLKGAWVLPTTREQRAAARPCLVTRRQRREIFIIGVGGLCSVPLFHLYTELPPFMGIMLVLGVLWILTEVIYRKRDENDPMASRVSQILKNIDMTTILFFLGILMAVSALGKINFLTMLGGQLSEVSGGNNYLITGVIGVLSSIVDNVPLVAASMGMYQVDPTIADFAIDGNFWQLLAYCAGVGGSMLIIGSAAGVVVMGIEGISFGWYLKHASLAALVGYLCGMVCFWLQQAAINLL